MNACIHPSRRRTCEEPSVSSYSQRIYPVVAEIFGKMFPIILALAVPALAVSFWRSRIGAGSLPVFLVHSGVLVTAFLAFVFRKRWSVFLVGSFMLFLGYIVAVQSLLDLGLAGAGMLYLVILCAFSGIFLGVRAGFIAFSVGAAAIIFVGISTSTGFLALRPGMAAYVNSPVAWMTQLLCYLMYMIPLVLATNGLHKRMAAFVGVEKAHSERLEAEILMREKAEEALRESEARLRQVIDLVPNFIFAKDQDGRFILANKAVADAFGTTVEDLTGKTDADVNRHREEVDRFRRDDLDVIESGTAREVHGEKITDAAGHTRLLHTIKIPFTVSVTGDRAVLGVSTDITAYRHAEEKAEEGQRRYKELADTLPQAIAEFDKEGDFTFGNVHSCALFGYGGGIPRDGAGNLFEIVAPEDVERLREDVRRLMAGEECPGSREYAVIKTDGTRIPVMLYASPVMSGNKPKGFRAIIIDISERKRIERAFIESETKYRSVVESSLVGFYIIQDDLFRFVNERFCDMVGYPAEEIGNALGPMDLAHHDDRAMVKRNIESRLKGETGHIEYDFRAVRKDGKMRVFKTLGSTILYEGRPAAMGTVIDITREKHLEANLRHAQKMEAIGTLTGGIAHDFNNILTALSGYGTLLQMRMDAANPLRVYVDQILLAAEKAAGLTKSLLTFGRKQPLNLQPTQINDVIEGTRQLLDRLLTEDVTLETHLDPGAQPVMADATQIDQILFNLVRNAKDSIQGGGTIVIETRPARLENDFILFHGFGEPGHYVVLSVSDTGMGMDAATREKIFEPFFTTKETGKGTGLGLATVYGIVKQHNGYITVYSERGIGTTFRLYFPVPKENAGEERWTPTGLKTGKGTILIAEDSDEVRRFAREVLKLCGYHVVEAVDGEDAVSKFQETEMVDLLILDTVMPKMNGKEAFDEIVRVKPDIKTLFMSGHTKDILIRRGMQEQEFEFISKPLSPQELLSKVKSLLAA